MTEPTVSSVTGVVHRPPPELSFSGNVSENWAKWIQRYSIYMKATKIDKEAEDVKVATFLSLVGEEALDIYNTFVFTPPADKDVLAKVTEKFDLLCTPQKNEMFERFKLENIKQKDGQTIDQFVTELKTAAKSCKYGEVMESIIRDRLVFGLMDLKLQEKLLGDQDLNLQRAIERARASEETKMKTKMLQQDKKFCDEVRSVKKPGSKNEDEKFVCKKCGYKHKWGRCPAFGKECALCGEKNHFAAGCPKAKNGERRKKVQALHEESTEDSEGDPEDHNVVSKKKRSQKKVQAIHEEAVQMSSSEEDVSHRKISEGIYVSRTKQINCIRSRNKEWLAKVNINNERTVMLKLDSGAEISILPLTEWQRMKVRPKMHETKVMLVAFGDRDFKIKPEGTVTVDCITNTGLQSSVEFTVVQGIDQGLLGLGDCIKLNLIKRVDRVEVDEAKRNIIKGNRDLFSGTGNLPLTHEITLKEGAQPIIHPCRRVPISLHKKLKETLDRLESDDIVQKVTKPTDWVNSLVIVEKQNGSLRLCLDPRDLNKEIKREHHVIPTAEDIIARLSGQKLFSVLDLKDGFFQIKLSDKSSDYCTFNTPFGRYKFKR
jgi:hypothetical protein